MTENQLKYLNLQETIRANMAKESDNRNQTEIKRDKLTVDEGELQLNKSKAAEVARANRAAEEDRDADRRVEVAKTVIKGVDTMSQVVNRPKAALTDFIDAFIPL